jgi:hypothetical protein
MGASYMYWNTVAGRWNARDHWCWGRGGRRLGPIASSKGSRRWEQGSIVLDPNALAGKPIIGGTRQSVEFVIGLLADGWSEADIWRITRRSGGKIFLRAWRCAGDVALRAGVPERRLNAVTSNSYKVHKAAIVMRLFKAQADGRVYPP